MNISFEIHYFLFGDEAGMNKKRRISSSLSIILSRLFGLLSNINFLRVVRKITMDFSTPNCFIISGNEEIAYYTT